MAFPVQNIREAAKQKGLTLAQIEKKLGIGNGVIAKWEKTKSAPPFDRIVAIADLLEVPVSLLTGDEPKFDIQFFAEKNPALENENGMDEVTKDLIDIIYSLSSEDRKMFLEMAKSITRRRGDNDN